MRAHLKRCPVPYRPPLCVRSLIKFKFLGGQAAIFPPNDTVRLGFPRVPVASTGAPAPALCACACAAADHPTDAYAPVVDDHLVSAGQLALSQSNAAPTLKRCYELLDLTSRSFAAVIQALDPELRPAIALFYLVLRGLDTVEDDMSIDTSYVPALRGTAWPRRAPGVWQ